MPTVRRFIFKARVVVPVPQNVCDYLAEHTGLAKGRVKDAMLKGALWLSKRGGKRRRLRRASTMIGSGDTVEFYYDPELLALSPPPARCLDDQKRYSVWFKPPGLMAQGTEYGDHCTLMRQAEIHFRPHRPVFLVHRLDREAAGVMLLAHDRRAAAHLSELFRDGLIAKRYRVRVRGRLNEAKGEINLTLDGKEALTRYAVAAYDEGADESMLDVSIETGRLHQIRRHFAMIGHPVLGDPRYGAGNKNREGMRLEAVGLRFRCPFSGREMDYSFHENFS